MATYRYALGGDLLPGYGWRPTAALVLGGGLPLGYGWRPTAKTVSGGGLPLAYGWRPIAESHGIDHFEAPANLIWVAAYRQVFGRRPIAKLSGGGHSPGYRVAASRKSRSEY